MIEDSLARINYKNPDDYILMKFGRRKHLERINNGILRLKRLSFFRSIEEENAKKCSAIADKNEGLNRCLEWIFCVSLLPNETP